MCLCGRGFFGSLSSCQLMSTKCNSCLAQLYTSVCLQIKSLGKMRTRVEKSLNIFRVHDSQQEKRDAAQTWARILRLLRTFADVLSCPPGNNLYAHHFKGKHGELYIIEKVNKRRFREKMNCQFLQFLKRKLQKWPRKWPCVIPSDKWINRVSKFGGFLWNVAWTFLRCCET